MMVPVRQPRMRSVSISSHVALTHFRCLKDYWPWGVWRQYKQEWINITLFLMFTDEFYFISRRVDGFPWSITIFINKKAHVRLSNCCESRRVIGSRLGQGIHIRYSLVTNKILIFWILQEYLLWLTLLVLHHVSNVLWKKILWPKNKYLR